MTVRELIEQLSALPGDMPVLKRRDDMTIVPIWRSFDTVQIALVKPSMLYAGDYYAAREGEAGSVEAVEL